MCRRRTGIRHGFGASRVAANDKEADLSIQLSRISSCYGKCHNFRQIAKSASRKLVGAGLRAGTFFQNKSTRSARQRLCFLSRKNYLERLFFLEHCV
ncbi:hypothetical protein Desti_1370 [Desulfomonile tiedjei DSM 6799]|uniref:Uncharacterized protein n=1 Tax=Desulfomonile tiedjei (strain ATCC 49306 / DSM 6799 / DCB-1) TaxID=706587 RepID=I4C3E1_DESTA|nr:hypothetical protein Desti_1370 [Desulfomonile tiedjei DSM 6799]